MRIQLAALALASALIAVPLSADPLARAATELDSFSSADIAVLLWAQKGKCLDAEHEPDRRICRELASALGDLDAGKIHYVRRQGAVTVGQYHKKRRSLPVVVEACLFCDGVDVGGEKFLVVGRTGSEKSPQPLRQTSLRFDSVGEANEWANEVAPRLIGDFLFTIPRQADKFHAGNHNGFLVDVKSYRVFDPCTGQVVASTPKRERAAVDRDACAAANKAKNN